MNIYFLISTDSFSADSKWHISVVKFSYLAGFLQCIAFSEDSFVQLSSDSGITGLFFGDSWLAEKVHHKMFITVTYSSRKTSCRRYYCFYNLFVCLLLKRVCKVPLSHLPCCSHPPAPLVHSTSFSGRFSVGLPLCYESRKFFLKGAKRILQS